MKTERYKPIRYPEVLKLSESLKTALAELTPMPSEIEKQKLKEVAEKVRMHFTGGSFSMSFEKDPGHSNYLAYIYTPIKKYWTTEKITAKKILFRSFVGYRISEGYESDVQAMWFRIRQNIESERILKNLPEAVVELPKPDWVTDSNQRFYCFVSEAEKLKKEFINNLNE